MTTAGRATLFSGLTVAVGLGLLIFMPVPFMRSMGVGGVLVPLVSIAASATFLPALLAVMGRGVNRFARDPAQGPRAPRGAGRHRRLAPLRDGDHAPALAVGRPRGRGADRARAGGHRPAPDRRRQPRHPDHDRGRARPEDHGGHARARARSRRSRWSSTRTGPTASTTRPSSRRSAGSSPQLRRDPEVAARHHPRPRPRPARRGAAGEPRRRRGPRRADPRRRPQRRRRGAGRRRSCTASAIATSRPRASRRRPTSCSPARRPSASTSSTRATARSRGSCSRCSCSPTCSCCAPSARSSCRSRP